MNVADDTCALVEARMIPRALVVEDEPLVGLHLKRVLEAGGFVVTGLATHLPDAVKMALSMPLDVAVLDVRLGPGMTSRELALILRRRGVPILLVTAHLLPGEQAAVDEAFAGCEVLPKPFSEAELVRRVRRLLLQSPQ